MTNLSDALDEALRVGAKVGLDVVEAAGPFTLADAYDVQRRRLQGWPQPPRVWKVGASNFGSSNAFQTRDPFIGAVGTDETYIFADGRGVLPLSPFRAFQGELEVVIRTGVDISSVEQVADSVDWIESVHLGIELPATRLDFPVDGARLPYLVADHGSSGAAVIGAALPVAAAEPSDAAFRMSVNGTCVAEGGMVQLTSPPVDVVRIVLPLLLLQAGGRLPKGTFISTGGVAPCRSFAGAQTITAEWAGVARLDLVCEGKTHA
ncbi:fumarylacetoacetate hydrolase family protein [Xanthobacter agilis]|jgi:2-keto-4-pentenoate hydratase|uniref:2-keto-4-pentenoate hydratase n=1 Tax=Xanthobacter agilis TaxID=47492 RepID=A0ABU0LBV6_XANAG|nr:fumarylacetoacetate hydrolase family protein [Xanthobacter agilis]MDQ0504608.1 2-keto-4-pentenoate hydratase [Xanthobacter agilis]